jgi:hypothetical protein
VENRGNVEGKEISGEEAHGEPEAGQAEGGKNGESARANGKQTENPLTEDGKDYWKRERTQEAKARSSEKISHGPEVNQPKDGADRRADVTRQRHGSRNPLSTRANP